MYVRMVCEIVSNPNTRETCAFNSSQQRRKSPIFYFHHFPHVLKVNDGLECVSNTRERRCLYFYMTVDVSVSHSFFSSFRFRLTAIPVFKHTLRADGATDVWREGVDKNKRNNAYNRYYRGHVSGHV